MAHRHEWQSTGETQGDYAEYHCAACGEYAWAQRGELPPPTE